MSDGTRQMRRAAERRALKDAKLRKRTTKSYNDSLQKLEQMGQAQLEISAYFNQKFNQVDQQQNLIYDALVKIANKFDIDLSESDDEQVKTPEGEVVADGIITGDKTATELDADIAEAAGGLVIDAEEDLSGKSDA